MIAMAGSYRPPCCAATAIPSTSMPGESFALICAPHEKPHRRNIRRWRPIRRAPQSILSTAGLTPSKSKGQNFLTQDRSRTASSQPQISLIR